MEALELTVDAFWFTLGEIGSTLMSLGSIWGVLGAPWELIELILEPIGLNLGCFGHPKLSQSGPGLHLADIVKTYENLRVFIGFHRLEASKLVPKWHLEAKGVALVALGGLWALIWMLLAARLGRLGRLDAPGREGIGPE